MTSAFQETQGRWDTFLTKIEERFHEILAQTEVLLPNVIALQDFDPTPFSVAWQGIEAQVKELISKIDSTWQEKVSLAFEEVKEAGETMMEEAGSSLDDYYEAFHTVYKTEQEKGIALSRKLERALKGYEVRTFATAARKLQEKAVEVLSKTFSCSQCKAPLPVKQNFFRAYYETCTYCQTVNTFEPGTIARYVEHFAVPALAEEKALKEYYAYYDVEEKFKRQREDEPSAISSQTVLETYKAYAEKYLTARVEIIPDLQKQFDQDLTAKVEHIRKWVLGEHGWKYTNPLDKLTAKQ